MPEFQADMSSLQTPQRHTASDPSPAASEPDWHELMALSEQGCLVLDVNGHLTYMNPLMRELLGMPDDYPKNLTELDERMQARLPVHEPRRRPLLRLFQQAINSTDHAGWSIFKLTEPHAQVVHIKAKLMTDGQVVMFGRDVTLADELDRRRHEFLSVAAHEIRTPLASVFGYAELLIKRKLSQSKQLDLLGIIHRQAGQLVTLINELLDLSRIEARRGVDFNRQRCTLAWLVDHVLTDWSMPEDEREVQRSDEHGDVSIWVDPDKTRQALLNVLTNAFKYSPQGGDIQMETVTKSQAQRLWAGIRVRDQGLGMSASQMARVFDKFYRVNPSGAIPGTGLGMSLVKEITELQDGHVQLVSELGKGTEITLWFPARQGDVVSGNEMTKSISSENSIAP